MFSRREFCAMTASAALLPSRSTAQLNDVTSYSSTLVRELTPATVAWSGRDWRCSMGSTWTPGLEHCLRLTERSARFEIRNTPNDRSKGDEPYKRRSEISGKTSTDQPVLPNDVELWSAMSFVHQAWDDPAGMARLKGGVHGQVHMGRSFGGSPAVAFRRTADGKFTVTTRGQNATQNARQYIGRLTFDRPHDLVYRLVLSPTNGSLAVWLDGDKVVDVSGASIGSSFADSYWNIGCYYAGGITSPVIAEYANVVYPGTLNLEDRIKSPPPWPSSSSFSGREVVCCR